MLAYTTSIQLRIGILPEKLGKKNQSKTKENKQTNKQNHPNWKGRRKTISIYRWHDL
jgi:hypothetical protein